MKTFLLRIVLIAAILWGLVSWCGAAAPTSMTLLPRQDAADGRIKAYRVESSADGSAWTFLALGEMTATAGEKVITFPPIHARYIKLTALSAHGTTQNCALAEIALSDATGFLPRDKWKVSADSENTSTTNLWGNASYAIDGEQNTFWFTKWPEGQTPYPHTYTIDLAPVTDPGSVTLEWTANPETNIGKYLLSYGLADAANKQIDSTGTSITVSGLTPGIWTFRVRAINKAGLEGPDSDPVSHTVPAVTVPPVVPPVVPPQPPAKVEGLRIIRIFTAPTPDPQDPKRKINGYYALNPEPDGTYPDKQFIFTEAIIAPKP